MATNFSLNVRRIRDLEAVHSLNADFVPSKTYVLVDAATANDKYTTYKMSVTDLSDALSGMVGAETLAEFTNALNNISNQITATVETSIVRDIVTNDFKNTISANVYSTLTGPDGITNTIATTIASELSNLDDFRNTITNKLVEKIVTNLYTESVALIVSLNIVDTLVDNDEFKADVKENLINNLVPEVVDSLNDENFREEVIGLFTDEKLATILEPLSANLIASTDFIAAIKTAIEESES